MYATNTQPQTAPKTAGDTVSVSTVDRVKFLKGQFESHLARFSKSRTEQIFQDFYQPKCLLLDYFVGFMDY